MLARYDIQYGIWKNNKILCPFTYICTHMHMHTHTHACTHTYTHTFMHACLHTHTHYKYSDAVSRCGVFCSFINATECCKTEGIVDVFQVVKALRIQKPGSVATVVSMSNLHAHYTQPEESLLSPAACEPILVLFITVTSMSS